MNIQSGMYIGIDLGTTNTVVAQVTVDLQGKFTSPVCLLIDQQVDEFGNQEQQKLLPSAVHVPADGPPLVGSYAHKRMVLGHGGQDVIMWWKNEIGRPDKKDDEKKWRMNRQEWSAVDAAATVLGHVREQLALRFPNALSRPVVTVPASFPESMKAATCQAIKQAGWLKEGEEPLLLYEPIAALMAYLVQYEEEQLPLPPIQRSPDWGQGGLVVVYDIGGGTVDVTLVRLTPYEDSSTGKTRLQAKVEDYAPHTLLGGFKFDEALAQMLLRKFCEEYGLEVERLHKDDRNFLYHSFLSWAETAKKRLASGLAQVKRNFGIPRNMNLGRSMWRCTVTQQEYAEAIAPLLGHDATINSPFPPLQSRHIGEADHIMEPLIRLLQQQALSEDDISAVLLIGGMGYVPAIRKRLKRFFGPQTVLLWQKIDPLQAVAYGAALHNAQMANERSVHRVMLRQAQIQVSRASDQKAIWQDLIPAKTSLPYGERFEASKDNLYFPAGEREVVLKVRYGGVVRRGIRFQLPEHMVSQKDIPFFCQVLVDSHTHLLVLQAALRDHPDITVQATFDDAPERDFSGASNQGSIPDPEANREKKDVPSLLRMLRNAKDGQSASHLRKELEGAAYLGVYVKDVADIIHQGNRDSQQHACILLTRIYQRYTYNDQLTPNASLKVKNALQNRHEALIEQLEQILRTPYYASQVQIVAAVALGWIGLWTPEQINIPLLFESASQTASRGLQVEAFRAIGRVVSKQKEWERLLQIWQPTLSAGPREAAAWAIARGITRYPEFVAQAKPSLLKKILTRLLLHGIRDREQNPAVEMAAWRAIALLSITGDIGQTTPIYAQTYPKLITNIRKKVGAEQKRTIPGRTDLVQQSVRNTAKWSQQVLQGNLIIRQIMKYIEPTLPIVRD